MQGLKFYKDLNKQLQNDDKKTGRLDQDDMLFGQKLMMSARKLITSKLFPDHFYKNQQNFSKNGQRFPDILTLKPALETLKPALYWKAMVLKWY